MNLGLAVREAVAKRVKESIKDNGLDGTKAYTLAARVARDVVKIMQRQQQNDRREETEFPSNEGLNGRMPTRL